MESSHASTRHERRSGVRRRGRRASKWSGEAGGALHRAAPALTWLRCTSSAYSLSSGVVTSGTLKYATQARCRTGAVGRGRRRSAEVRGRSGGGHLQRGRVVGVDPLEEHRVRPTVGARHRDAPQVTQQADQRGAHLRRREIGRGAGRSGEVQGDRARSREIRGGPGRSGEVQGGHGRSRELKGARARSRTAGAANS